jgi:spermidine synthase
MAEQKSTNTNNEMETTFEIFESFQPKLEHLLTSIKNKLDSYKPCLLYKPENIQFKNTELQDLFTVTNELPTSNHSCIIDCLHFINYTSQSNQTPFQFDQELLNTLYNSISDKGSLILLLDINNATHITDAFHKCIGDNYLTKLFIKLYLISKVPSISVLIIQKMSESKTPISILSEKLLMYEIYDNLEITKPDPYIFNTIPTILKYMLKIYQYHFFFQELHPNTSTHVPIQRSFFDDDIEFVCHVIDSNDPELLKKKTCAAILVSKTYANDFIYFNIEGNMALCNQVGASRIMLIRPSPFNFYSQNRIKTEMVPYIVLFKFKDCVDEEIPIMNINDEGGETYSILDNSDFIVRDVVENEKKETFRQLIFKSNKKEIQSEVKLLLTSKTKVKNANENEYISLPTCEKYSSKNLVSCLDDSFIAMFYVKSILTSITYVDLSLYPQETFKSLVLGSGIGTISYFLNKVFRNNCENTLVEENKMITQLGKEYFGLNKYDEQSSSVKDKWVFCNIKDYVNNKETKEEYYDLIVIDVNNTESEENISPPLWLFDENVLNKIKGMLKGNGMFVCNLLANNYKRYWDAFDKMKQVFGMMRYVDNNEDMNKILFCFKNKITEEELNERERNNFDKMKNKEIADVSIIEGDHDKIIGRIRNVDNLNKH